jgi:Domain of unknown function (DUF5979)
VEVEMFASRRQRRRAAATAALTLLGVLAVTSVGSERAEAFKYPDDAQARLLLDGTQSAPHDGFNMQIDTNGFESDGGSVFDTHMFCINATLPYRCGLPNELVRTQADPSVAGIDEAEANRLAWILTNHEGYDDEEVQHAIWCVTDPGEEPDVGASATLCADSAAYAVPAAPLLSLSTIGSDSVTEGEAIHFQLVTNAKTVDLSVDDGGDGPALCGSAPDNASATIASGQLTQADPVGTRTFELCVTRDGVDDDGTQVELDAELEASMTNLQVWVHPDGATTCQGVIDTEVSAQRLSASASGRFTPATGSLTIRKSTVGEFPDDAVFTVTVEGMGLTFAHDFPDDDGDPFEHTFTDLPAGTYTVTETVTGGATTVEISNGGVAIVDREADTVVDIVNSSTGNLVLEKATDRASEESFEFTVECQYLDEPVGKWSNPFELAANETFDTGQLPAGTTCAVAETDAGTAVATVFAIDVGDVHSEGVGAQAPGISIEPNDTVAVTFTNVYTEGSTTSGATTTVPDSSTPGSVSSTTDPPVETVGTTGPGPGDGGSGLPITGSDVAFLLWLAVAAALGGGGLAMATRQRRAGVVRD